MYDVVSLGEILIDFSPAGKGNMGNPSFEMNPGGAPVNCLAEVSALGGKCAFIGKVGEDMFGDFLRNSADRAGVDTTSLLKTDRAHTTLAFVSIGENGERSFSFLRNSSADILIEKEDIDLKMIDNTKIFHFGSLSLTCEPSRSATLFAADYAGSRGKLVSYDPNYRPALWKDEKTARRWMLRGMEFADIVKISDYEMEFIYGIQKNNLEEGSEIILGTDKKLVLITCGENGSYYRTQEEYGYCRGFSIQAVDTTGCGDAFTGAILYLLSHEEKMPISDMVRFANCAGALCATRMGGMPAMPSMEEIKSFLYENS